MTTEIWVDEEDENNGLWLRHDSTDRVMYGVAFPDPREPECHIVRYVGKDEADADDFAATRGGLRVNATQTTTVERTPWKSP